MMKSDRGQRADCSVRGSALSLGLLCLLGGLFVSHAAAQTPSPTTATPATSAASGALDVKAPAGTIIWVDNLRYGAVPESGELTIRNLRPGSRTLRARLKGKREVTKSVAVAAGGSSVTITLAAPAEAAEVHFQAAEELRERGRHKDAVKEYREAIRQRKGPYAAAQVGLARSLMSLDDYDGAVSAARRAIAAGGRTSEAYTVIANTLRVQGLYDEAAKNYRTALAQGGGVSPEANTGLAITLQEQNQRDESIRRLRLAAAQSNGTEPVIYFLLGTALERENRNREALEAYEKFLQLEPNGRQSAATRSIIKQLRRDVERN
jgi:tetratricopeptide (TPR) repeat protein